MFNLSEAERKTLIAWGIVGIIIFLIVVLIQVTPNEKDDQEPITTPGTNYVNDRNRYYTVKNAITKYYSFVNAKDYDAVIKILDSEYVKANNINEDTITNYISNIDIQVSYNPGIMCLKSVQNGVYIYAVDGVEVGMNSGKTLKDQYYEIVLDGNTSLFSVKPIVQKEYEEVCNG